MALAPQPTLSELTGELLSLIGQGGTGVASAATQSMAHAAIRRAQATICQEAAWLINRKRSSVSLAAGATTIDWPDDTEPGNIHRISAYRTSNTTFEWDLSYGITPDDRTAWANGGFSTVLNVPYKYDFHDGAIEVGPASSEATTIWLIYDIGRAVLQNEGDRPNCDGEAVLLLSEIIFRNRLGGEYRSALPECERAYQRYLDLTKAKYGASMSFAPGSGWAFDDMTARTFTTQRHWMYRDRRP